jgi:uncharacterized protein YfiM (DUF2279 family)
MRSTRSASVVGALAVVVLASRPAEAQPASPRAALLWPVDSAAISARRDSAPVHPPADGWFAQDKAKHFLLSGFLAGVGASGVRLAGASRDAAPAGGAAFALGIGVLKEVRDRRAYGHFSVRDLVWDALGAMSTVLLLRRR